MNFAASIIKYLFMAFTGVYTYAHLLGNRLNKKSFAYGILFSLFVAPILLLIKQTLNLIFPLCVSLLLFVYHHLLLHKPIQINIFLSIIATGLSYVVSFVGIVLCAPLSATLLLILKNDNKDIFYLIYAFIIGLTQFFSVFLLFHIRRFRHGIPNIEEWSNNGDVIAVSVIVLFIVSPVFFQQQTFEIKVILFVLIIMLGLIAYLWWRRRITDNYLHKVEKQNQELAEQTILAQQQEIEYLSKIVHKDNKLIAALQLALEREQAPSPSLYELSAEREQALLSYRESSQKIQKTNVFQVDAMLQYLLSKSLSFDIQFDVSICGNTTYFTKNIMPEEDLTTLLADLGENAVLATKKAQNRHILISIGVRDDAYYLDVFDSAPLFDSYVIEVLGQQRYTTRHAEGGSGIGLMTTMEFLRKYHASFEMEEYPDNSLYTKRVSIIWDGLEQIRISSTRNDIKQACIKNQNILFCNEKDVLPTV